MSEGLRTARGRSPGRGVAARTIRYYESIDLIAPTGANGRGYRLYDGSSLARLGFVRKAQYLGLSLAEERAIARSRDSGIEPCAHVTVLLAQLGPKKRR